MTDPAIRERAALDVLARLPDGWRVGPTSYDPGTRRWSIAARAAPTGLRSRPPETLTGHGADELAAFADLRMKLDERRKAERLDDIERRSRAAFLEGAEERSQAVEGRPLTADEQERVTKRYPTE